MIDDDMLSRNIDDANTARALIELCENRRPRFWEKLIEFASEKLPPKPEPVAESPMDDWEATRFECSNHMPFGVHVGKLIADTPIEYLAFLVDDSQFRKQIRRYLKSRRAQDRDT